MTDSEILQLYRSGERDKAFRGLVSSYKERLYWHIRRMVLDHDDTDDCLQNTFVKVWQSLERFRGDSQLYTWLYRIATNESLTFLARQQTRGGNIDLAAAGRLSTDPGLTATSCSCRCTRPSPNCPPSRKPCSTCGISRKCPTTR